MSIESGAEQHHFDRQSLSASTLFIRRSVPAKLQQVCYHDPLPKSAPFAGATCSGCQGFALVLICRFRRFHAFAQQDEN